MNLVGSSEFEFQTCQVRRILKFSISFGFGLVWFGSTLYQRNMIAEEERMGIFPHDFFAHKCCYKTHTYWNTTHHIWNMCLLHLACKILARVFPYVCFFVENNLFFWEEKKVPSCISLLSKKASEEVFIMCTLKKIGFIIWCGTVS